VTPSPGPPRLKKTPAAVHPLPQGGEGLEFPHYPFSPGNERVVLPSRCPRLRSTNLQTLYPIRESTCSCRRHQNFKTLGGNWEAIRF
jgi:hypothetical protein